MNKGSRGNHNMDRLNRLDNKLKKRVHLVCYVCGKKSRGKFGITKGIDKNLSQWLCLCEECYFATKDLVTFRAPKSLFRYDSVMDKNGVQFAVLLNIGSELLSDLTQLKNLIDDWRAEDGAC